MKLRGNLLRLLVLATIASVSVRAAAGGSESTPILAGPAQAARHASARPAPSTPAGLVKALAEFNRGAALLEQYRYTDASKAFESVLESVPDWEAAHFNLGLAYLNVEGQDQKNNRFNSACRAFDAILKANPQHLHARFCRGLCYQHAGDNAKALQCFEAVYERDQHEPSVTYKCAETLIALGRNSEGIRFLQRTLRIDPGYVSAAYRLALQYQRTGEADKADALFQRFQELNAVELTGGSASVQKAYGMCGKYYLALGADDLPLLPSGTSPGPRRVLFSPQVRHLAATTKSWQWNGGLVGLPGIAVGDLNGDGHLDLVLTGIGPNADTAVWVNDGAGHFSAGQRIVDRGVSPCLGDVDNAGRLDLWLGTASGGILFQNDGKGQFSRRSSPGLSPSATFAAQARLWDIDCDGDLDLLAFGLRKGSIPSTGNGLPTKSNLYRNNRDGTFTDVAPQLGLQLPDTPVAAIVSGDFDNDGDMDLVIFPSNNKRPIVWVNDRAGKYHLLDAAATGLDVRDVISVTSGDPNKDGKRDLLIFAKDGVHLFMNHGGFRFEEHKEFRNRYGRLGGTGGQFADMKNDGNLDLLIADAHRRDGSRGPVLLLNDWPRDGFLDAAEIDSGLLLKEIQTKGDASCVVADFCGKGRCDVLLAPAGSAPMLIQNITPGGHWIELDLVGARKQDNKARSNGSAIGARVEIRTGPVYQQHVVGATSGPVAMPSLRVHAGLGDRDKVEWLRIVWPDGVLQAEVDVPADRVVRIEELPRKVSSCPVLFAWDGERFQFVSDFGGKGGLGYLLAPGRYAPPVPREYIRLPNLEPDHGDYVLQVAEPLEEVVYFDEAKLIAVNHPAGSEVYPNEMMPVNAPPPAFEALVVQQPIKPVRAIDHREVDVTDRLLRVDRRYAGATELDERFTGFAKDHFVDLDFGDRLKGIAPDSRLIMMLDGWVEYGYSATGFAASQAGLQLKAPSIFALRDGQWVELFHDVGYPAGLNHTMTLDVTGKILPSDRRIRVSSNMEIYWDRICLSTTLDKTRFLLQEVAARSADLHFLGYPREYSPDGRQPNLYDYHNLDRSVLWKSMEGNCTRFGEVTELLRETDDRYVIMGPGEEVTLRFPANAFGPVPTGKSRTYFLKTDSYCKDMDPHTAHPDFVGPLPFHAMSGYPYRSDEQYPDNESTRAYQLRFNTRRIHSH
jgi:tetratricopeptide (TPR) repeat protein